MTARVLRIQHRMLDDFRVRHLHLAPTERLRRFEELPERLQAMYWADLAIAVVEQRRRDGEPVG